jgi:hypothetical protein
MTIHRNDFSESKPGCAGLYRVEGKTTCPYVQPGDEILFAPFPKLTCPYCKTKWSLESREMEWRILKDMILHRLDNDDFQGAIQAYELVLQDMKEIR